MNETMELIINRASLRKFADKPVTSKEQDKIIEGAMRAPTAGNMMLYSIIIVNDQDKKEVLSETCDHQPFIKRAPLVMIFLADFQRWYDYYELAGVKEYCSEEGVEFTTPTESELMLGCCDALIAAQNAVLTAESLGIGSCYIGDIMENYEQHQKLLSLPKWTFPIAMLVMGHYPERRPSVSSRFDKKYIVFEDEYRQLDDDELKDMKAERNKKINPENRFNAENFGQYMYARKTGADFSREMTRSVRKMLKNWQGDQL